AGEPAGDGVAREPDDAAGAPLDLEDQRVVEPVEVAGNLLGASPATEHLGELGGEGGEARDVGEQHAPVRSPRDRDGADQMFAPVLWDVGTQDRADAVSLSRYAHLLEALMLAA